GAWAWDGQEIVHRRTRTSTPRDTVGAGDAFNAALIRALFVDGESLSRALDFANMAALLAITSSPRRYPTFAEVRAELARSAAFAGQDSESGEVSDMDGTLPP
ncbi:MAG: PfkB family carbohydrate kinase, partial [Bacillota bacterium]